MHLNVLEKAMSDQRSCGAATANPFQANWTRFHISTNKATCTAHMARQLVSYLCTCSTCAWLVSREDRSTMVAPLVLRA